MLVSAIIYRLYICLTIVYILGLIRISTTFLEIKLFLNFVNISSNWKFYWWELIKIYHSTNQKGKHWYWLLHLKSAFISLFVKLIENRFLKSAWNWDACVSRIQQCFGDWHFLTLSNLNILKINFYFFGLTDIKFMKLTFIKIWIFITKSHKWSVVLD